MIDWIMKNKFRTIVFCIIVFILGALIAWGFTEILDLYEYPAKNVMP